MLDIKGNASNPLVARLSNFTPRSFVFHGVKCASLEGFLQSLKCESLVIQREICLLEGKEAKRRGQTYDIWKDSQILWWVGKEYHRLSRGYLLLVTDAYDAVYHCDASFRQDLLAIGYEEICHTIGNPDMCDTVLTEVEMIYQLNRLRIRAFCEKK